MGSVIKKACAALITLGYGASGRLRNLAVVTSLTAGVAAAEETVIVAFGDSLTQGYGLAQSDGFVPQLDRFLSEAGVAVDVRNAGVSGDTTAGGLSRVDWTLTPDVDGMIVALGANDYLRGLDPTQAQANLAGILERAAMLNVPVLLVGIDVGNNFGPDYKAAFATMYAELSEDFGLPLYPDFMAGLRAAVGDGSLFDLLQNDGIHPNAAGVTAIVADLGPEVARFVKQIETREP